MMAGCDNVYLGISQVQRVHTLIKAIIDKMQLQLDWLYNSWETLLYT
jgi:hypothetical protein